MQAGHQSLVRMMEGVQQTKRIAASWGYIAWTARTCQGLLPN
jgi:hypothetical protein